MVKPLALVLFVVAGGQAWKAATAPGPSSAAHQRIADDCDSCHMPFKGLPNEKCLTCHTELRKFHAAVAAQKCNACHTEHKGAEADQTKAPARASFDHGLTGMPLVGAHKKVQCKTCHDKPIDKMGDSCVSCHKDPHKGAVGNTCVACHRSEAWKPALHLLTEHKLPMEGGHAKLDCAACHKGGSNLTATVACAACHERAHGGTRAACDVCHNVGGWKPAKFDHSVCTCTLPQKHQTVGCLGCHKDFNFTSAPTLCSGCHEKERKHEALGECSLCHSAVSWKKNEFDHNKRSKFKLTGEHLKVACERCHAPPGATLVNMSAVKFKGVPQQCEGCHQKKGDDAHGNFGPCLKCHDTGGFKASSFDHASTGFPLEGRHAKLGCKDCHSEKTKGYPNKRAEVLGLLKGALAWNGAASDVTPLLFNAATAAHGKDAACSFCHKDPHSGSTQKLGECSSCHSVDAWKPSTFTVERHNQGAFPLTGKHTAARCALCHSESRFDDAPTQCARCHVDRHAGRLGDACEKCHTTAAFKPASNFNHTLTGFALAGGHARVPCAGCHEGRPGAAMAAAENARACTTCHAPQHGKELGPDCAACHDVEKGPFSKARGMAFAHQTTGFALERRHATLACGACHKAAGPPPIARCGGCHTDVHSGQLSQDCEDCHVPDRWRLVRFDHDRTGWPLRGRHFTTPCVTCHTSQRWVGLTDDCWDCHAASAARARSIPSLARIHTFGPLDCAMCHTSQWKW
jgi:hypothetical protein